MGNFIGKHVQAVNGQSLLLILEPTRLRSYESKKCCVRAEFPSTFKVFCSPADNDSISLQRVVVSLESESGFISNQILGIGSEMKSVVRSSVDPVLDTPVRCVW